MVVTYHIPEEARLDAVRRLLGRSSGGHVVLELPLGWSELDNAARMRLLQRQAQMQKIELALVTRNETTRKAAKQVGVPVFMTLEAAQQGNWRMTPVNPPVDPQNPDETLPEAPLWRRSDVVAHSARPTRFKTRQRRIEAEERYRRPVPAWMQWLGTILMGGLIVAFLAFFSLFVLPAATITLVPGRELLTVSVPLTADANVDVADIEEGIIPARLVETTIEEYGTIATTGSQQKPTVNSVGSVLFSNLGNTEVRIPLGTEVTTSTGVPVAFRTTNEATLPAGVGERVEVSIEAIEPGIGGNVRANTINTVSGPLRFRARVTNPGGTFGGGSELVPVVTQADQDALREQLNARIEEQAQSALAERVNQGEWLDPESVQTYVLAQVFDQFRDDEATELGLTLRVLVQGVAVETEEMNEAMLLRLQEEVPPRGRIVANSFRTQRLPGSVAVGRTSSFTGTASADYIVPIDPVEAKQAIAGMTPQSAVETLAARWPLASQPDIYQDPAWMPQLPRFPSRIQVRVEYGGALAVEPEQP